MTIYDDINRILRDHEKYLGDGRGGKGALPIGDPSTRAKPISKHDLREVLTQIAAWHPYVVVVDDPSEIPDPPAANAFYVVRA